MKSQKQFDRGVGRSIYFPSDMDTALKMIEDLISRGATRSLSEFACTAIKEKLNREATQ